MSKPGFSLGKHTYLEVALRGRHLTSSEKKEAEQIFARAGIFLKDLAVTDYKNEFRLSCYTKSFQKLARLKGFFRKTRIPRATLKIKKLGRHDWFDKWQRDYHMRPIGKKFMIVPVWERQKFKSGLRLPIYLEPASAFGSGYHETTRLMVQLLEFLNGKIKDFLDIGTGTGILSIVAAKLGACNVAGFDNDKPSVVAARKNFKINACQSGHFFGAELKRLKLKTKFDVVGANLISKTLLECRRKILSQVKRGGHLLVSGVFKRNFCDFRKEFEKKSLKCLKILKSRQWVALLYKKTVF